MTAPAPEDLLILPEAANVAALLPQVTVGVMRSQLATGFLAGNPNPTPASHKPGNLLGSAASVAREGFRGRFGSESAPVAPAAHPADPASALLSLPRDRSLERSPKTNPQGIFSTVKWKCSSNMALPVP